MVFETTRRVVKEDIMIEHMPIFANIISSLVKCLTTSTIIFTSQKVHSGVHIFYNHPIPNICCFRLNASE
jgi:hypothetical protein